MGQIQRRSSMNEYGIASSWVSYATKVSGDNARLVVDVAKDNLTAAQNAHYVVTSQIVHSLSERMLSTREIADILGISKSAVNRYQRDDSKALAASNVKQVSKLVRQAWGPISLPLTVEQLNDLASQRRQSPRMSEVQWARAEGREAGIDWPYQLSAYTFPTTYEATRDSLVMALGQSAWMAASLIEAGSSSASTLWGLWEELKNAETTARFDQVLMAVFELADQDRCWISWVEPPQI